MEYGIALGKAASTVVWQEPPPAVAAHQADTGTRYILPFLLCRFSLSFDFRRSICNNQFAVICSITRHWQC